MSIYGVKVDSIKLQAAKLNPEPAKSALQLMGCLFTATEMVNGNPSGVTNSKYEGRKAAIRKFDPNRMKYIHGELQMAIKFSFFTFTTFQIILRISFLVNIL